MMKTSIERFGAQKACWPNFGIFQKRALLDLTKTDICFQDILDTCILLGLRKAATHASGQKDRRKE